MELLPTIPKFERSNFARNCLKNKYCLVKTDGFKIFVDE